MSSLRSTITHLQPLRSQIQYRLYSTTPPSAPLILSQSIPAPHLGSIRVLLLNRPTAKNALSWDLLKAFREEIDSIASEAGKGETRALVIGSSESGVGGVFCAGADLKERKTFTPSQTTTFLHSLNTTFTTLSNLLIPTISCIPTHAHGGGLELALSTDLRITHPSAQLSLPETRLGIIPGAGGTRRISQIISRSRALDMVLTGRRVGAVEALNWGLVDRVVEEGKDVNDEGVELAKRICEGGPLAIVAAKRAVKVGLDGGLDVEGLAYGGIIESQDKYEALKAFAEKRKPEFKGR
ncbi:hypothetical protein TWF569_001808 [Orbilia oligospora]|uniref:Enoyl-CoA hydratase n=1 Tax=Orbilia oligospora TaxID=2813651 RepID=A0A7C8P3W0_ORBOL|nr:hypothetical protein TWF102_010229 [Orbilia oligospora]KAF3093822.1 hypothetical protein TWF103_010693 [Orbilia oligospora]KAF3105737.1 hypothetical protein TWF706_003831 [Orbilia oligospora]KAF3123207.1 hypothetical protein TWF569_001808 [Orbilia oligospora]KAF3127787.1 hypothetical protein TWF703_009835 [Orbilia oligospora]